MKFLTLHQHKWRPHLWSHTPERWPHRCAWWPDSLHRGSRWCGPPPAGTSPVDRAGRGWSRHESTDLGNTGLNAHKHWINTHKTDTQLSGTTTDGWVWFQNLSKCATWGKLARSVKIKASDQAKAKVIGMMPSPSAPHTLCLQGD